jgi:archaellum component FlaF (FlaF/FlaG flagellin family)
MTELSPSSNNKLDNKLKIQTARDKLKAYYGLQNTNNNENKAITNSSNNNVEINLTSVENGSTVTGSGSKLDNLIKQGIGNLYYLESTSLKFN